MSQSKNIAATSAGGVDVAMQAAESAARDAGVHIRELDDIGAFAKAHRLFHEIWQPDPNNPPMTTELMRALTKAGNYVAGAYIGDDLVAASVAFSGTAPHAPLHSHITGVAPGMRGRRVGFALKAHQRSWALHRRISVITWTFDPLMRRNASFNLGRLGALPVEYLTNFYGAMGDGINGIGQSDRLLVRWDLESQRVHAACAGQRTALTTEQLFDGGASVALACTEEGAPERRDPHGDLLLVAVPRDIERLRTTDPALVEAWRAELRETLRSLLLEGAEVTGFDRSGSYVVTRNRGAGR